MLTGRIQTDTGAGGAGSAYRTLVLTNSSNTSCDMEGYPGVSFVDDAGRIIGAPANRAPANVTALTLQPGDAAIATLQQTNAQNYGPDCGLTQAHGVRIYPPDANDSVIALQDTLACSSGSIVLMTVGPMQPEA